VTSTLAEQRVVSGLAVQPARPDDLPALRALLGERPMSGAVRLALVPGPDADLGGERRHVLVVRDGGRVIGTGTRTVRDVWLAGRRARVGFLTRLRFAPGTCLLARLQAGFAAIDATRRPDEAAFDLTTIVDDNGPARRLLQRGLLGLPRYVPVAALDTLVFAAGRSRPARDGGPRLATDGDREAIADFLRHEWRGRKLAPAWQAADLHADGDGPAPQDTLLLEEGGAIVAVGALRDRRLHESVVVAGYAPWLALLRRPLNIGQAVLGRPALPPPGAALALGHVAALAVRDGDAPRAVALLAGLRGLARERGLRLLAASLAGDSPLRAPLRRAFAARSYRSTLHAVAWREGGILRNLAAPELDASWL